MIIKFDVQNFGSIKEKQTLSFEADKSSHLENYYVIEPVKGLRLLKLGLIYGANASGKTTILCALEFLRDLVMEPREKKIELLDFKPFLFDENTPKQHSVLSIEFLQNKIRYSYQVLFNENAIVNEELYFYDPKQALVYRRSTDLDKQFTQIEFGSKIKADKAFERALESNTLWNNTVLGGYLKTNIESKELKDVTDWFKSYLRPMIYTRTRLNTYVTKRIQDNIINKETVVNILKNADFNISDIQISEENKVLDERSIKLYMAMDISKDTIDKIANQPTRKIEFAHTINNKKYFLSINDESEGTQRYYEFAGLLTMLISSSIALPIDELESSLHPDLYTHFLLSFLVNSKNSQLIATTHNREILNNKDIFRNDVIWFTDKNENGATELYSLSDFTSTVIRDTTNIFNAYKTGKLGGTPNLGDYYIETVNERK